MSDDTLFPETISITVCGDGGTGKSSLSLRLVRSCWTTDYDPTIQDFYTTTRTYSGRPYHLHLTDTAGQEEYRGLWSSSGMSSDAYLLVYDVTNKRSLEELEWFDGLIEMEAEMREEKFERERELELSGKKGGKDGMGGNGKGPAGAGGGFAVRPVKIVAGNKVDLSGQREVTAEEGLKWARGRGAGFMETSARNCVNVEETFELLVRRVVEAREAARNGVAPPFPEGKPFVLPDEDEKERKRMSVLTGKSKGKKGRGIRRFGCAGCVIC
ncbi:P-loop containing nucleoside triphosphate hydrolase protein [Ascobolus immersus RN42]|uniref:P-loop containing nucleoside triphosphate hydrolase protein n=1 Tax=Ascobolus immersus RN42 TaxID=1160509 RepID=A0A3N4HME1_ASCIM|nr:P-loop containing nucleoside triphosphate hydrolase protein [Ascobolus immersus RN42]